MFGFLPIVLAVFFLGRHFSLNRLSLAWLVGASLFFYAWWNATYLSMILASVAFNYVMGWWLDRLHRGGDRPRTRKIVLFSAVASNLLLLGYYKYTGFMVATASNLLHTDWHVPAILLPLGISFFTFTQIAFLVDASRGLAREADPLRYALFVFFFPHLIAGPILHHSEMMPQFSHRHNLRFRFSNIEAGLVMFVIGLFKKIILADTAATYADPSFPLPRRIRR